MPASSINQPNSEHQEVVPAAAGCLFTSSVSACVLSVFTLGLAVAAMCVGRARFTDIFHDFDAKIPTFTTWLLSIPVWLSIGVGVILAAVLILKEVLIHQHVVNLVINLAVLVLVFAWSITVIVALWLPLLKLM